MDTPHSGADLARRTAAAERVLTNCPHRHLYPHKRRVEIVPLRWSVECILMHGPPCACFHPGLFSNVGAALEPPEHLWNPALAPHAWLLSSVIIKAVHVRQFEIQSSAKGYTIRRLANLLFAEMPYKTSLQAPSPLGTFCTSAAIPCSASGGKPAALQMLSVSGPLPLERRSDPWRSLPQFSRSRPP